MRHLLTGHVISMLDYGNELFRILQVWRNKNKFCAISVQPKKSAGRTYFSRHQLFDLDKAERQLVNPGGLIRIEIFKDRPELHLNDDEIQRRYPANDGSNQSKQIVLRDKRWEIIYPVWEEYSTMLFDISLFSAFIKSHCEQREIDQKCSQSIKGNLYQFFAGGMRKNALLPLFSSCGGKGNSRQQNGKKLGRPNKVTISGIQGYEGFICGTEDRKIMAFCWDHFLKRDISVRTAYLRMCREFYAVREQKSDYRLTTILLPVNERPTESQFKYRGPKLTGKTASEKQRKRNEFAQRIRPLFGKANDGVKAVGQLGALDSTSTDTHLVSILSRLDRIGYAYRIQLVDTLYSYIPGIYMGLSAPSALTVKLALLNALTDKAEWLKNLGLEDECPVDDWIPIQFANVLSDNGELRNEEINQSLLDSGMMSSLAYIPSHQSARNGIAESMHRRIHKLSDHSLLGSTYGRMTERGEEQVAIRARHTLKEAIRDSVRAIHHHNTTPQLDRVLTTEMKIEGVRPTPLDMTRWSIERGYVACSLMDIDEARMRLMPIHDGVFTESGVRLLRPDTGKQRIYIRCLRYVSKHSEIAARMEAARNSGVIDGDFLIDIFNLRKIWFKNIETAELIPLDLKTDDDLLKKEGTWSDVMAKEKREDVEKYFNKDEQNQKLSALQERQENLKREAVAEYKRDLDKADKPPCKKDMISGRAENRERENNLMINGVPIMVGEDDEGKRESDVPEVSCDDSKNDSMVKEENIFNETIRRKSK
jgi:hypothetical protein